MKKNIKALLLLSVAAFSLQQAAAEEHLKSVNPSYIDTSIAPGEDFYNYATKGWQIANPLTPEYAVYTQFNALADKAEEDVKNIVLGLADSNPEPGSVAFKVSTIYNQGMDSVRRNALGAEPIKPLLKHIEDAQPAEMNDLLLWMHKSYGNPFFGVGHQENLVNSNEYAMYMSGGGLTLGDRDYYLSDDKENKKVREGYIKLIQKQMRLAGYSKKEAKRIAANVLKIETAIADSTWTREQSRNIPAMYNPRTIDQVKQLYPNVDWDKYFTVTMGFEAPAVIIVTNPNTMQQANDLIVSTTDREKKDYYLWKIVNSNSGFLSDDFAIASFEFNKILTGQEQMRPRWKTALGVAQGSMGEAIGQLYVEKFFPASSKEYMIELVENLRTALGKHIINLPWMSDDTKLNAIKKLNAFTVKIGYPDKWKDYSELNIDPALTYYENMHNVRMWAQNEYLKKWGKPVDKTEWGMTPQTVNAYYNPLANEIVFPAAILQAPYFDPEATDAENYGGIGVVIGHEMTHGFDDQGRNFDAQGNMIDWWTPEDAEAFAKMAQGLIDQFSAVEVLPGLFANGQYTLGENIADQGGLRVSRTAFLDSQKKKGVDVESEDAKVDGFTPMQIFYLNYANIWAGNIRPEAIRSRTMSDVHSLGKNRVNVTLRNIEPFFEAFSIDEDDAMYRAPEDRVVIW